MPDGTTYSYTYNDNNDVQNIRIPGVGAVSYPSYTLSRPDSMSFPGGSQNYQYDALLRLNNIDSQHLDYTYSYDTVSNILTKSTEHGTYGYDYDDLYRLTDVDNPTFDDETYTYDSVGNRLTASGVSGAITHNANNELEYYGDISYAYDANGNMVSTTNAAETRHYIYNVQNRLVRVEDGSGSVIAEYGYDPFGRRLWKEVDGIRTYFFYADEGLVTEYDSSGHELRSYGYRPDSIWTTDPLWLKEDGEYSWYQNDHLGMPQKLIDRNGNLGWDAQYTAFGDAQIQVETVTNNLRFPGQYYDVETGLHYNYHRSYDPKTGRYTKADPIGFFGGDVNWYVYMENQPGGKFDPWGLAIIVLDPGHGDVYDEWLDPGTLGLNGKHEKDYALDLANAIEAELIALGHTVIKTRSCDKTTKQTRYQWRADISNNANADYFISIHLNSFDKSKNYFMVAYYSKGKELAKSIADAVKQPGFSISKAEQHKYQVLRRVSAPAVLIEAGNIKHPDNESIVTSQSFINQIVAGIQNGIEPWMTEEGGHCDFDTICR